MKPIIIFLFTVAIAFSAKGYAQDTLLRQEAARKVRKSKIMFVNKTGDFILTQDSVIFHCKKKNGMFNLSLSYKDIKQARGYSYVWALPVLILMGAPMLEHGVRIKMKNGQEHSFSGYNRKAIVKIIKSKIG